MVGTPVREIRVTAPFHEVSRTITRRNHWPFLCITPSDPETGDMALTIRATLNTRPVRIPDAPRDTGRMHRATSLSWPLLAIGFACGPSTPPPDPAPPCAIPDTLLDRRYDQVTYLTTHNAMSNMDEGWQGANQRWGLARQLDDGVRGFMLDVYEEGGRAVLCHALCALGKIDMAEALGVFRTFLEAHPDVVLTFQLQDETEFRFIDAAFTESGLDAFVHVQAKDAAWPTLRAMAESGRRLVVFAERRGGSAPWFHDLWTYSQETHYSFDAPAKMDCAPNRGNPDATLFTLNHFLTKTFGSIELAQQVNFNPFLIDRARRCESERGLKPNFVAVDFYDVGDACAAVQALNAD